MLLCVVSAVMFCTSRIGKAAEPSFTLTKRFPISGIITSVPKGVLLQSADHTQYQFYDWTLKECWRIVLPDEPSDEKIPMLTRWHRESLSLNGHVLAISFEERTSTRVIIWDQGRQIGSHLLPYRDLDPTVLALDDGRVFYWGRHAKPYRAYLMQGKHLLATGLFQRSAKISPDGSAVVWPIKNGFHYATVTTVGKALKLTGSYRANDPLWLGMANDDRSALARMSDAAGSSAWETYDDPSPSLYHGGRVVTLSGAVYGAKGLIIKANDWRPAGCSLNSSWIIQSKDQNEGSLVRIFNPQTEDSWQLDPLGTIENRSLTKDGQYLMMAFGAQDDMLPPSIQPAIEAQRHLVGSHQVGVPQSLKRSSFGVGGAPGVLAVYQRPGQLIGTLPVAYYCWWWYCYPTIDSEIFFMDLVLSPDGRTILAWSRRFDNDLNECAVFALNP